MILRLDREDSITVPGYADKVTWGDLYVNNSHECVTLEDEVREQPAVAVKLWKVPKRTAFPAGVYMLGLHQSPTFGPDALHILKVEGFSYVLIHGGTDINSTEACVIVGTRQDRSAGTIHGAKVAQRLGSITVSPALPQLRAKVVPLLKSGEEVRIQVRNGPSWYKQYGLAYPEVLAA